VTTPAPSYTTTWDTITKKRPEEPDILPALIEWTDLNDSERV